MRIIAGRWRGRRLAAPPGQTTRPTSDRLRQAIFDMICHAPWAGRAALEGALVLDLFAGTGAMGLEALSRGAAACAFLERDRAALRALHTNIAACAADAIASVYAADACRPPPGPIARLVFIDPPYQQGLVAAALAGLAQSRRIDPTSLLICELAATEPPPGFGLVLAARAHGAGQVVIARMPA